MNLVSIHDIKVPPNRQRKEFARKELEDLKASIVSKGLMHPPVVRDDGVTLVAGERRVRAILELYKEGMVFTYNGARLQPMMIPTNRLADLPPLEVMEAELEENTIRMDLTWQEKATALMKLRDLREAQAKAEGKVYTDAQLSEEVKGTKDGAGALKESIILAKHMDIPEVAAAKTQKDAVKVLRKIKETEHRAELASKVDLEKTEHDIRHGSMTDFMPLLEDNTFDLILTDPPYGVGADEFGDMASTGHNYKDSWEHAREHYRTTAEEGFRVAKAEAHCYAFCTFEHYKEISDLFDLAGWNVWPRPLIWNKGNGMLPRPEHGPRYTYECILFASKGDRRVLYVRPDVITVSSDRKISHGAQKPVELYVDLISRSCLPGNRILDPFGGSGTAISAATESRCFVTLFEIDKDNYNICLGRLKENALDQIDLEI